MATCNFVGKMLLMSIISMSNYTFIVCDLEGYMSPHYNVLPEAVCCCLLVNHVVYKHVTMTTLLWLRIPTHPQIPILSTTVLSDYIILMLARYFRLSQLVGCC